jgi:hemolysin III
MSGNEYQADYSRNEEIANVATHGLGIILSLIGLLFLILKAHTQGNLWHMMSFIIFGISLFLMYSSSTLYHIVHGENIKRSLRKLDHSAIYFLIAGTYTPFLLTSLRSTTGWIMFTIVWLFAIVGIIIKMATEIRSKWLSAIIYLVMGWLAVFIAHSMIENLPMVSIIFIAAGGLFYTTGVIFYVWKKLPYHHAVWHLFVLAGSISHFFSIYFIL